MVEIVGLVDQPARLDPENRRYRSCAAGRPTTSPALLAGCQLDIRSGYQAGAGWPRSTASRSAPRTASGRTSAPHPGGWLRCRSSRRAVSTWCLHQSATGLAVCRRPIMQSGALASPLSRAIGRKIRCRSSRAAHHSHGCPIRTHRLRSVSRTRVTNSGRTGWREVPGSVLRTDGAETPGVKRESCGRPRLQRGARGRRWSGQQGRPQSSLNSS